MAKQSGFRTWVILSFVGLALSYALGGRSAEASAICPGHFANEFGGDDSSAAFQACLDALPPGGTLAIPYGLYRIDHALTVNKAFNLTTAGLWYDGRLCRPADHLCATLQAGPFLSDTAILVGGGGAGGSTIDHVIFDGNRAARAANMPDANTRICGNYAGRTVYMQNSTNSRTQYSAFINTLCGTAYAAALTPTTGFVVYQNIFSDNGDHNTQGMWSDGLTIGSADSSYIINNYFYNNSDVSLILGGAINSSISGNVFVQSWQGNFASLMLTNWTVGATDTSAMAWASFQGSWISSNTFDLGSLSEIAIEVGVLPWGGAPNLAWLRTMGGHIADNIISSNKQHINISGGGTPAMRVEIHGNAYYIPAGNFSPAGLTRKIATSPINIERPEDASFVQVDDPTVWVTHENWDDSF